jgi:hypothetical protein
MNLTDGSIQLIRNKISVHVPFMFSSNMSKIFIFRMYNRTKEVGSYYGRAWLFIDNNTRHNVERIHGNHASFQLVCEGMHGQRIHTPQSPKARTKRRVPALQKTKGTAHAPVFGYTVEQSNVLPHTWEWTNETTTKRRGKEAIALCPPGLLLGL